MYVNQNFNLKFYKGGEGVDFCVNKWIHGFNSKSPIENMNIYAFHYWNFL